MSHWRSESSKYRAWHDSIKLENAAGSMSLIDNVEEIFSPKCTHILKRIKLYLSTIMQQSLINIIAKWTAFVFYVPNLQQVITFSGTQNKCFFVYLEFFVPLENFSFIWKCHYYRWRVAKFGLSSAPTAIEQWGFLSVPHLL